MKYTPEQEQDVKERQEKGLQALKDLQLVPAALIMKAKLKTDNGAEVFADQLAAYLQDTKYSETEEKPVENA